MDNRPIGIFDSGLGGLTVLKELRKKSPNEDFIYFGDCGRIPYGTKSEKTVQKYTTQDINFLLSKDVKAIIIACNTASAYGYKFAKLNFETPIFEVVTPGSRAALDATTNGRIGVIGTPGTISSNIYSETILSMTNGNEPDIFSRACPMFVPLAEEGWWDNEIAKMTVKEYLCELKEKEIDTLILGCTHYPLLQSTISEFMGEDVKIVSSGIEMAKQLDVFLKEKDMQTDKTEAGRVCYYTSDSVKKFRELGKSFLGEDIQDVENIVIERF